MAKHDDLLEQGPQRGARAGDGGGARQRLGLKTAAAASRPAASRSRRSASLGKVFIWLFVWHGVARLALGGWIAIASSPPRSRCARPALAEAELMDDRPIYMISVAAELVGMHPQTLRMYETKGLVRPQRTPGGTRLYSRGRPRAAAHRSSG